MGSVPDAGGWTGGAGLMGLRRAVMAWTLVERDGVSGQRPRQGGEGALSPVKGAGEDEVVVCADLVEAPFVEGLVVDQAAGLVDDDEGEDGPLGASSMSQPSRGAGAGEQGGA